MCCAGVMKVGDNTFPNLLALLTGLWAGPRDDSRPAETRPYTTAGGEVDNDRLPFLWRNWARRGCVTLYTEDQAGIGTFNYGRRGFREQPTDYYHRSGTQP